MADGYKEINANEFQMKDSVVSGEPIINMKVDLGYPQATIVSQNVLQFKSSIKSQFDLARESKKKEDKIKRTASTAQAGRRASRQKAAPFDIKIRQFAYKGVPEASDI